MLAAVERWAAQRGGPAKLQGNKYAPWDFLEDDSARGKVSQCRTEIVGGQAQRARGSGAASIEERLRKHREVDPRTRKLLGKKQDERD